MSPTEPWTLYDEPFDDDGPTNSPEAPPVQGEPTETPRSVFPLTFEVVGDPAPQGNKSRMPNGAMVEGNSKAMRAKHKSWRTVVSEVARDIAEHPDVPAPLDGALHLLIDFRFSMPKSRPRRVQVLGEWPKTSAPDLDKLIRSVGDALTQGGLIRDDARITAISATKQEVTGWTGAVITLSPYHPQEDNQ